MVATHFLLAAFAGVVSATIIGGDDAVYANLLKRQQPGTPSYNCHDNCGTAISLAKQPGFCDKDAFKSNYNNCLQCAGPDNYNIWRHYGNSLSTAGKSCGLETEPKSGKQPDVGPAEHPGSAAPSATPAPGSGSPSAPATTGEAASTTPAVTASSGVPRPSNSTASFTASAPPQQSTNAAAANLAPMDVAGVFGAIFAGALLGM